MEEVVRHIAKMSQEFEYNITPIATEIRMSALTLKHILADQGELSPGNFDPLNSLLGIKVFEDEEIPYGIARIKYSDGSHQDVRVRVMIAIKWR